MKALLHLVAAVALVSWATTSPAAADDDGPMLADAGGLSLPTYGLQAITAAHDAAASRVELAGLRIDDREQPEGIGIVREGERTRIALETLLDALGFSARRDGADARVDTPLGTARIRLGDCLRQAGGHFCAIDRVAAEMALDIDAGEFSVRVRTAWPRDAAAMPADSGLPADIAAPRASFSYARTSLDYRRGNGSDGFLGSGEFGGWPAPLRVSIGVGALATGDFDALRRATDRALYTAKRAGRNRVVTVSEIDEITGDVP